MKKKPAPKAAKKRTLDQIVKSMKESLLDAHVMRIEDAAFKLKAQEDKNGDFLFPTEAAVDKFDAAVGELSKRVLEEVDTLKLLAGKGKKK
jgi:hypothetical protein